MDLFKKESNLKSYSLDEWFGDDLPKLEVVSEPKTEFPALHDSVISTRLVKEIGLEIERMYSRHSFFDFENMLDVFLSYLKMDEEGYMSKINEIKDYEGMVDTYVRILGKLLIFFMQGYYDDILGQIYQDQIISKWYASETGTFYTPFSVARLLENIVNVEPDTDLYDGTCGTGVMFIAAKYQLHLKYGYKVSSRLKTFGQDINQRALKMCEIQMILTNHVYMKSMLIVRAGEIVQCKNPYCTKHE